MLLVSAVCYSDKKTEHKPPPPAKMNWVAKSIVYVCPSCSYSDAPDCVDEDPLMGRLCCASQYIEPLVDAWKPIQLWRANYCSIEDDDPELHLTAFYAYNQTSNTVRITITFDDYSHGETAEQVIRDNELDESAQQPLVVDFSYAVSPGHILGPTSTNIINVLRLFRQ